MNTLHVMQKPDIIHNAIHAVVIPVAVWLWNERRILKNVIQYGYERRNTMSFKSSSEGVLLELVSFIEGIFKHTAPVVVQATEQAAATAAITTAEQDPRTQAVVAGSVALLQAAQQLKAAIQTPPAPNVPVS